LALWATLGVLMTFAFVSRLTDRRAGVFSAIVLATTPLYFVHAKTMLGDVVTMAAVAMSFGGLTVSVFDRGVTGLLRLPWLAIGAVGLASGFYSRGAVIGLAVPCLAVGLAWGISWVAAWRRVDVLGDIVGGLSLVLAARVVWQALHVDPHGDVSMWLGAAP